MRRAAPRREPAPYFVGPRCVFVCVCVCALESLRPLTLLIEAPERAAKHPGVLHRNFGIWIFFVWIFFVILLLGSVEHLLVLLFVGLWFAMPRYPHWVRLTLARREHEARALLSSARAATAVGAVRE